jgi:hypothetical protein
LLKRKRIIINKERILAGAKKYKHEPTEENFEKILGLL